MRKGETVILDKPVGILGAAVVVGKKEKEGPLGKYFENVVPNDLIGEKTHEKAEAKMHLLSLKSLLNKVKLSNRDIDVAFAGDLDDEIVSSSFTMREMEMPFYGIYNACATFGEGLSLAAMTLSGGFANHCTVSVSSHFCTAERQYRYPLELGSQRTPLSQWTVTAAAAFALTSEPQEISITAFTTGTVIDYGVTDANNMGGAMAPAARDTLVKHFTNTATKPSDYDMIYTGDLGDAGSRILKLLMDEQGYDLSKNYYDCGQLIYNKEAQKVGQGGSGAACAASVFGTFIMKKLKDGELKKILIVPTGALLSKISSLQKESIPSIAHAVQVEVL